MAETGVLCTFITGMYLSAMKERGRTWLRNLNLKKTSSKYPKSYCVKSRLEREDEERTDDESGGKRFFFPKMPMCAEYVFLSKDKHILSVFCLVPYLQYL